jgi:5-methylthioadenosine/S-adenosylhomocysteine deaminase
VRVDADDVFDIAAHQCGVAHCPASNAKLAHGIAPVAALLAAGIRVGLGSDSVASSDRMDLLDEARLASLFATARECRVDALPARNALELATLGGARALRLENEVGTLEVGKAADLAAFPLDLACRAPVQDPISAAVFAIAGTPASFVAVEGRVHVRDGALLGADAALPAQVQRAADLLCAWLTADGPR